MWTLAEYGLYREEGDTFYTQNVEITSKACSWVWLELFGFLLVLFISSWVYSFFVKVPTLSADRCLKPTRTLFYISDRQRRYTWYYKHSISGSNKSGLEIKRLVRYASDMEARRFNMLKNPTLTVSSRRLKHPVLIKHRLAHPFKKPL
jgi:hypothetical protein